jgi:lipopolysaccharide/colanic/teichoic acid biosynthesis glycosyltransferase
VSLTRYQTGQPGGPGAANGPACVAFGQPGLRPRPHPAGDPARTLGATNLRFPAPVRCGYLILPLAADVTAVTLAAALTGTTIGRAACYGLAVLIVLTSAGTYRQRICLRVGDEIGRLAGAAVLPAVVLLPWTAGGPALRLAIGTAGLLIGLRTAAYALLRAGYRRGLLVRRTLIIGGGEAAGLLARLLCEHPELGLRPCGTLDDALAPGQAGSGRAAGERGQRFLPVLGSLSQAGTVIASLAISQVLVCGPAGDDAELVAALSRCRELGVRVSVLPTSGELGLAVPRACLDEIWGVPFIPLRPGTSAHVGQAAKRLVDLAAATAMLLLSAPLVLLLAAAVWLDLRLPPLFWQRRVVGRGRQATIAKVRTLRPAGDPNTAWAIRPGQCSALGSLLRRSHLDELPQLVNVLRGEMSLVGPRPERPYFARQLGVSVIGYADRERARAGLTGWAQVHGLSGDSSIEDRARFDNCYIEYWSIWLDLLILARTPATALATVLSSARGGTS